MNLSRAREDFIEHKKGRGRSADTLRTYNNILRQFCTHVSHLTGAEDARSFTGPMVESFLTKLSAEKNYAMKSIACVQTVLREFGLWGVRKGKWARDPLVDIDPVKVPRTLPRPFSADERGRLLALEHASKDEGALFGLLFFCGLRRKECSGLNVDDVQSPQPSPEGWSLAALRIRGKGNVERIVPVAGELWPLLEDLCLSRPEGGPLLRDQYESRLSTRAINIRVAKWGRRAQVEPCTPHRFRHGYATRLLQDTGNLRVVQEAMGHASPTTTAIYTKVSAREVEAAVRKAFPAAVTPRTDSHAPVTPGSEVREEWEGYA